MTLNITATTILTRFVQTVNYCIFAPQIKHYNGRHF